MVPTFDFSCFFISDPCHFNFFASDHFEIGSDTQVGMVPTVPLLPIIKALLRIRIGFQHFSTTRIQAFASH